MYKVSAVTFIGNAIKFDYPIIESINSLLPYVDEYIINVKTPDEDGTKELLINEFGGDSKVKIFESEWETKEKGTRFFSSQTNKAIEKASGDWIFYLQADECIHEDDAKKLHAWIDRAERENQQGITFNYLHFEKDYNHIRKDYKNGGDAYDKEIRLFKNNGRLMSFGDAQSFCFIEDLLDQRGPQPAMHRAEELVESPMTIYHYGYVKNPKKLLDKKKYLNKYYKVSEPDRNEKIEENDGKYVYNNDILEYIGIHPSSMKDRITNF